MSDILIFGGTTEGRELSEFLQRCGVRAHICVATEYGERELRESASFHHVHTGRMDEPDMEKAMSGWGITLTVDATHPYAAQASQNIREACQRSGCGYVRLQRELENPQDGSAEGAVFVPDTEAAVAYLRGTEGPVLAASGGKELFRYTELPDYKNRVYARVLPSEEAVREARELGFEGAHLICMQGPFSQELNTAMLRSIHARYLVTKASGKAGGFPEKLEAARRAGAVAVVIGCPPQQEGMSVMQVRRLLCERLHLRPRRQIALAGAGMGSPSGMTREAWEACRGADVLIGAARLLESVRELGKPMYAAYMPDHITAFIGGHPEYEKITVLFSGDPGFYSGAEKLCAVLEGEDVRVYPGVTTAAYLGAKAGISWDDACLASVHGRSCSLISRVHRHAKVFVLIGRQDTFRKICADLISSGLGQVRVTAGCRLSYPDERILQGTAEQLKDAPVGDLTAVFLENPEPDRRLEVGMDDERFVRGSVPMTKSEVRAVCIARLRLREDSVCWDVGAGTGSVSVEMAMACPDGQVWAVEKDPEALSLIRENARRFRTDNLFAAEGTAPAALRGLPAPTHVFVGGSSGRLGDILKEALRQNPLVRVVISAITLETVSAALAALKVLPVTDVQISSVTAARSRSAGKLHLMAGENPVYIISFTGEKACRDESC